MRSSRAFRWLTGCAGVVLVAAQWPAFAQESTLRSALAESSGSAKDGARVQAQIDTMADQTTELLAEYRLRAQELDRLEAYNKHLGALVADQKEKLSQMDGEIEGALIVQQEIVPLMNSMIDNLAAFQAADMPILTEERSDRLQTLRDAMPDSDVTTAEKYRLIMAAYQSEMDIGRKIGTFSGEVVRNGQTQAVNFLHVGRILLAFQSEDRTQTAFWNKSMNDWDDLPAEYRNHIDQAMRVANKQAAPVLLQLPIHAPEAAQ